MELLIPLIIIISAYFLKGLSGFGPALIMIPFLTIIYDPPTAIIITTTLDFLAGLTLVYQIRREISWSFVIPIIITMGIGASFGAYMLGQFPIDTTRQIMGITIGLFALYMMFQGNLKPQSNSGVKFLKYPVGIVSGLFGGMLGISGPPLVIYMKLSFAKAFFRTQLIVIFLFGAGWRLVLYHLNQIGLNLEWPLLIIFIIAMILGVFIGNKVHLKISETFFTRLVAVVIFITAIRMLL
jgi:uncharacterized membrane protein YfcA